MESQFQLSRPQDTSGRDVISSNLIADGGACLWRIDTAAVKRLNPRYALLAEGGIKKTAGVDSGGSICTCGRSGLCSH